MADSHPYISGPGNIAQMVKQLRNSFPATVTSDTVKRLGIAPNNESYVINALQFIGVLDGDGKKTEEAAKVFSNHKDDEFSSAFEKLVKNAYSDLFDLHGDATWTLDDDALITFFRQSDQTSATIGKRQAGAFKIFTALSGHGELPTIKGGKPKIASKKKDKASSAKRQASPATKPATGGTGAELPKGMNFGLTVRVEINLPSDGSRETYDNIFRSIKENLIDG